jgi:hypothetical protein
VILFGKVVRRLNDQQPLAHETPPHPDSRTSF